MSDILRWIFLLLAGVVVPVAYLVFLIWMVLHGVWWFTYFAYFCLFGALGGWCFAVAMSPSGLAATSIVFLVSGGSSGLPCGGPYSAVQKAEEPF